MESAIWNAGYQAGINGLPPMPPPSRTMHETMFMGLMETEESKQRTLDWKDWSRGWSEGCTRRKIGG